MPGLKKVELLATIRGMDALLDRETRKPVSEAFLGELDSLVDKYTKLSEIKKKGRGLNGRLYNLADEAMLNASARKLNNQNYLRMLKVLRDIFTQLHPKAVTLKNYLSRLRKTIKATRSSDIYVKSMKDTYFNIPWDVNKQMRSDSTKALDKRNEDQTVIDTEEQMGRLQKLIISSDVHEKILGLLMACGARPYGLVHLNKFFPDPQGRKDWMLVTHLAKKREKTMASSTIRPVVGLSTKEFLDQVAEVRQTLKDSGVVVVKKDKKGNPDGLATGLSSRINDKTAKWFPELKSKRLKSAYLRKYYGALSYTLYAEKGNKRVDRHVWITKVLGHSSAIIARSYSDVVVKRKGPKNIDKLENKIAMNKSIIDDIVSKPVNFTQLAKQKAIVSAKSERWIRLERIWKAHNGKIANTLLRKMSKIGARLVNKFVKQKKQERFEKDMKQLEIKVEKKTSERKEAKQPEKKTTNKPDKKTTTAIPKRRYNLRRRNNLAV